MQPFTYTPARSTADAIAALTAHHGAMPLAGGTDLVPLLKDGHIAPHQLVDLKRAAAPELRALTWSGDGALRIGALVSLAQLERDPAVRQRLPIIEEALRVAATPQLRSIATVGGNLLQRNRCWYFRGPYNCWLKGGTTCFARDGASTYSAIFDQSTCVAVNPSDLAPALMALDAHVEIAGTDGSGRTIAVAELFAPPRDDRRIEHVLGHDELITAVIVPAQPADSRGTYVKVMERQAWAFALVSIAAQVSTRDGRIDQARIVLGGVSNTPRRAKQAEDLLTGEAPSAELAHQAARAALAGATPLAQNGYKLRMAEGLIERAVLDTTGLAR